MSERHCTWGFSGRRTPQPGSEGVLRAAPSGWQTEEGGFGGLHAQAVSDPQRCPQTPYSLEVSSLSFPLTFKTVASSSCPKSLRRIGSLLFMLVYSPNDWIGSLSCIDIFATRPSAQPLSNPRHFPPPQYPPNTLPATHTRGFTLNSAPATVYSPNG